MNDGRWNLKRASILLKWMALFVELRLFRIWKRQSKDLQVSHRVCLNLSPQLQGPSGAWKCPSDTPLADKPALMSVLHGACHIRRGNNPWNDCSLPTPTLLLTIPVSPLFPNSPLTFLAPRHSTLHLVVGLHASQRRHLPSMYIHTHKVENILVCLVCMDAHAFNLTGELLKTKRTYSIQFQ